MADTIESITGSVAISAGLYSAHDFLRHIGVLNQPLDLYADELCILSVHTNTAFEDLIRKMSPKLDWIESQINYKFNNRALLVQALIHKSYKELWNSGKEIKDNSDKKLDDYERLEFLGDAILNFWVAQYFFKETMDRRNEFPPKNLHKMKVSIVNNVLLSVVIVEKDIHRFVLYNEQSQ